MYNQEAYEAEKRLRKARRAAAARILDDIRETGPSEAYGEAIVRYMKAQTYLRALYDRTRNHSQDWLAVAKS